MSRDPKGVCFYPIGYFDGDDGSLSDCIHSWKNLHMVLNSKTIGSPAPKTLNIEIPGSDGSLDLTEYFGEVKYGNRTLSFTFTIAPPEYQRQGIPRFWGLYNDDRIYKYGREGAYSNYLNLRFTELRNKLHGKRFCIILDDDWEYFYIGRVSVTECSVNEFLVGEIKVECDCEPYKYLKDEDYHRYTVDGSKTVNLYNSRKKVIPVITADAEMNITFQNSSYSISSGTYTIPEICLEKGSNSLTVTGSGTIVFKYRRGEL